MFGLFKKKNGKGKTYEQVQKPKKNDIALHIRRTDYTQNNFHKVIKLDYYYNSLKQILKQKKDQNIIHTLMGNDVSLRKEFIVANAINVSNLDI